MPKGVYKHGSPWNKGKKGEYSLRHAGQFQKGSSPWNKGKTWPEEVKLQMSAWHSGPRNGNFGKPRSEETKRKIRLSQPRLGKGLEAKFVSSVRRSQKYKEWREGILRRDGFACRSCGRKAGKLHADHIIAFSRLLRDNDIKDLAAAEACDELWRLESGRTLCIPCHYKTNNYGSKAIASS